MSETSTACIGPPTYSVTLLAPGCDRLRLMATLRSLRPDLGPKAAKAFIDSAPQVVLREVGHYELDSVRRLLSYTGGQFEYRLVSTD